MTKSVGERYNFILAQPYYYYMKKSQRGVQIPDEVIEMIIKLRANRHSYNTIGNALGISKATALKYAQNVKFLPENMCKTVEIIMMNPDIYEVNRTPDPVPTDLDYYIDTYVEGERFLGPLDQISLEQLQELMQEPTDYHSKLSMSEWADYYLGGFEARFLTHAPHLWCQTQYTIFDMWEQYQRLMIECFRGIGKTMCADGIITHEICENRDNNYFIMSETRQKAGMRVKHIGNILLTNKKIIADYGFLPHVSKYQGYKESWKIDEITVKRHFQQTDPTLMAFSSDSSNATGAHFAGGVFDDVWSFKLEQNGERNKEKWLGWYDGELEGCLENAWELWLLTRKGPIDLYQELEDRQFHVVYKVPAVLKFPSKYDILYQKVKGQKIFDKVVVYSNDWEISDDGNGRFSIEYLIEKMTKMDKVKWESEYQLNPIAAKGKFWKWSDIRFIDGFSEFYEKVNKYTGSRRFKIIGFMDLGFGKSARADYSALCIVALWEHKFYLLETYLKRGASEKDMLTIFGEAVRTFPELRTIYIEDDLQQTDKVSRLKKICGFVNIQGFSSRQETARLMKEDSARRIRLDGKALRIWCQLEGIIEANKLYVNKYMHAFKEFRDEFTTFPSCKHFDLIDALANGTSILDKKDAMFYILSGL